MATSYTGGATVPPYHGVVFGNLAAMTSESWIPVHHPAHNQITPYVPSDNQALIKEVQGKICENIFTDRDSPITSLSEGMQVNIILLIPGLNLKDVKAVSEVSRRFYVATKAQIVWDAVLRGLFPQLQCMPPEKTSFTPEQQCKIIFKRVQGEQIPYVVQSRLNDQAVQVLLDQGANAQAPDPAHFIPSVEMNYEPLMRPHWQLQFLVGRQYDGTPESIDQGKQVAVCRRAIETVRSAWVTQEKFEGCIKEADIAKATLVERERANATSSTTEAAALSEEADRQIRGLVARL
jgi:hypothetical protein